MTALATIFRMIVAGAAMALSACGGGGGDAPVTPPIWTPSAGERIEPYDPGPVKLTKSSLLAAPADRVFSVQAASVQLGPLAVSALLLHEKTAPDLRKSVRQKIGVARVASSTATSEDFRSLLNWQHTGRGTQIAAVRFESDDAHGVRLGLRVRSLPAGTVLRFYGRGNAQVFQVPGEDVLRTLARNLRAGGGSDADVAANTYWSPDFGGSDTALEIELPVAADLTQLDLAVPTISHFFVSPDRADSAVYTKAGAASCSIDVSCRPEYSAETRAVARLLYVEADGGTYVCTGTLLNDSASSATPYLLTANHCVSTQAEASSVTTDWFYRSSACNSGRPYEGAQRLNGGATLLYAEAATDASFLRLNAPPPQGVLFAGSYFGAVAAGARVVGIHHAKGDLQKVSDGSVLGFENCSLEECVGSTPQAGRFMAVKWSAGITQGGSSGSGVFLPIGGKRYVVGQLLGGASSCQTPDAKDYYGRFDMAFRDGLKTWLQPNGDTGPLVR